MKKYFFTYTLILISVANIYSQRGTIKVVKPDFTDSVNIKTLNGYFIVSCFTPKYNCKDITLANNTNQAKDCNFYKSISSIGFIKLNDLDLKKTGEGNYRNDLLRKQNYLCLSINRLILLEASAGDSSIFENNDLVQRIQQNIITAELFETEIGKFKLDFLKKNHYYVLLKGAITVIDIKAPNVSDLMKNEQYLILNDVKNKLEIVKIIEDSF